MKQYSKAVQTVDVLKKRGLVALARNYKRKNQFETAEIFYGKVLDHTHLKLRPSYYYEYAHILHRNKNSKRALKNINYAIEYDDNIDNHARYFILRAEIFIQLRQYADAENDINYAIKLNSDKPLTHYISGIILILQKKWYLAEEALLTAEKLGYNTMKFYRRLGQASFAMKNFKKAANSYEIAAKKWDPNNRSLDLSNLYYMVGLSYEKLGNNELSESFYKKAIKYDEKHDSENLGIGIFHNNFQEYDLALEAYSQMKSAEPLYRAALLHDKMGNKDKAINYYKKTLSLNQIESKYHFRLAVCYESIEKYDEAVKHYKHAIDRHNNFNLQWYLRLLNLLDKLNKTNEYKQVLYEANIIPEYVNNEYQNGNNRMARHVRYNMFYNKLNPVKNIILFESFNGSKVSGNPLAIFKQMLKDDRLKDKIFIWSVNNKNVVPKEFINLPNVIFVNRFTDLYYKYLSKASILINNVTFPPFFILKNDQKYLNTWHGTPWKKMGSDIQGAKMEYGNVARNFIQATHLSLPNQFTFDHQIVPNQVANIYQGEAVITGYPRIDLTYQAMKNKQILKNELNLNDDKQVILYAPTWRGNKEFQTFDQSQLELDLKKLSQTNAHILFRGHHQAESVLTDIDIPNIQSVPEHFDTNELLGITDILITDYSSVFFDFLVTNKPIVHYVYDYDDYKAERGLYFDLDELPGSIAHNTDELIRSVNNYLETNYQPTEQYLNAKDKFVYKDDGNVAQKVIEWVVFDKKDINLVPKQNRNKEKILFHGGGFKQNGVTTSFINLANAIDKDKYDITVIVPEAAGNLSENLEQLNKLNDNINIIPRHGAISLHDGGFFSKSLSENDIYTEKTTQILKSKYQQEFKRLFSNIKFNYIIDFDGYSPFYNQLLAYGPMFDAKKVVIVHSDIYSEYLNRFPKFNQTFRYYQSFDKVVSVSEPTAELNKNNLSEKYQITESKFDYMKNIQGPEAVLKNSLVNIDNEADLNLYSENQTTFITMGRLSEEKDHEKLIRAFSNIHQINPKTKLLILGDGPLKYRLDTIIKELQLQDSVHLLGHRSNPYPYVAKADCFVLSSNYEGQPIVLFEAMVLEKQIIATDIVANRDILKDGYGELCENSIDGLTQAMNDFIDGKLHSKDFDIDAYNDQALKMFYDKVL